MRVFLDDQIFTLQTRGGISRYFTELMHAYGADAGLGVELTGGQVWTANRHQLDSGLGRRLRGRLADPRVATAVNRLRSPGRPDIVHHTFYDAAYLNRRVGRLRVVTVYDMIPEVYPELFPSGNPHLAKRAFVERADLVLSISAATHRDLVSVYGESRAPVVVTPLGVHDNFGPGGPRQADLPHRYVLFVGNRAGYKDFDVLAQAFAGLSDPDVQLVVVGGGPFDELERARLTELGIAGRVVHCSLDDASLRRAYAHALCFVFPSRHEGFGLPTLEAMACGCPTVLVDSSSHPEVGGDAALYFPPGDVAALRHRLIELVESPTLRADRAQAGIRRAALFTWERTARATADAYRDLVAGK
jgi:glycosyltransferase involved in cell wall biosynthesis